jgi:hypothetical protein
MKSRAAALIVSILLSGCASKVYQHPLIEPVPAAPSANVYFFREDVEVGTDFAIPVFLDGEKLLQLKRGTYAMVSLKPGIVDVEVQPVEEYPWQPCGSPMEFLDGRTYFLLLEYKAVGLGKCFSPELITEERARSLMDGYAAVPQ